MGRPIPYLDNVAREFPDLTVVAGHIGHPWTEEMIALATKYETVYIDTSAYIALYDRFGYRTAERDRTLREAVIDKGADAVVRQRRLGRIENDAEAFLQLALIGFDRQQSQELLAGEDPETVQEQEEASARAQAIENLSTVPNIGETRASQLFRAGVESVPDLAEEDQTTVGQATDLNAQQARDVIDAAQFIVQQGDRQQS